MLILSAILAVLFAVILWYDHTQFQQHLTEIAEVLKDGSSSKLEAAWFSVVVVRFTEFLVPSLILGAAAIIMHVRDNRRPKQRATM